MKPAERWKIFLAKAAQDELAADKLSPMPESADEIVGFHLQQAAEKLLKALLVFRGIEFRRTDSFAGKARRAHAGCIGYHSRTNALCHGMAV
ncbi:HEPN domain-containing protein [bacterium]|nr:HEPN domain-containing protein [bacterium]